MTQYTEHFSEEELTYSATACKYRVSNLPTETHKKTLIHTCKYFAEPCRKIFNELFAGKQYKGKTVKVVIMNVTSGYRSDNVNKLLEREGYRPSYTSQHCKGEALDFEMILKFTDGSELVLPYNETYSTIMDQVKKGKMSVDQCIMEKQGNAYWIHCSYKAEGATLNRKQFLRTSNGINFINDN